MGLQFSQAEFCAVIAIVFSEYSVKRAIREGERFKYALWNAEYQLSSGMVFELGLKMKKPVPLRLDKRPK